MLPAEWSETFFLGLFSKSAQGLQVIKPGPGRPAGIVENRTVYDALENIDSEFYPRKISVPDTENDETETTSKFETNKKETTNNLKPKLGNENTTTQA